MKIKKQKNGLIIALFILTLLSFGLVINNLYFKIAVFTIMTLLSLYHSRFELLNPLFWFVTIFYLYGIANSAFSIIFLNIESVDRMTDIDLSMIALTVFFTVYFLNETILKNKNFRSSIFRLRVSASLTRIILVILVLVNIFFVLYLRSNGITTKLQLMNIGIIYGLYTNLNILYFVVVNLHFAHKVTSGQKFIYQFILIMALNFLLYYHTGERDIIVFPIISMGFLLGIDKFKFIKIRQFVPALIMGVISLPLLLNLGVRNSSGGRFLNFDNFLYRIFSSELISASKNIELILSDPGFSPLGLIIPISVVINSLFKIPTLPSLINFHGITWFTERYYYYLPEGAGAGFSIIAEGYIFAGIFGVVIWFVFISNLLFIMFKSVKGNLMALNIYCVMAPIIMYSIRGSLETIFIYLFRIIFFYVLMFVIDQLLVKKVGRNKINWVNK